MNITPVLGCLNWLLVIFRIDIKVLGPQYIADMLTEYKPNRSLRSLGSHHLEIQRVQSKHLSPLLAIIPAFSM